ncbi:hypothetical protein [Archangium sp.]|uniref:hypothetical protein n=1 Tax=Archangium sp. TaxID=1872627 RepID=UPI00286A6E38|nr:hypothetical protein [Archangium sp.]
MKTDGRRRMSAAALGFLVVWMQQEPARAQQPARKPPAPKRQAEAARYITGAEQLYEDLEYERALEQLAQARRLPRSLEEDVRIALLEGLILADMGKRVDARAAFKAGLLLDPEAPLPVNTAPKVELEFEEVRAQVCKQLKLKECKRQENPNKIKQPETSGTPTAKTDPTETPPVEPNPVPPPPPWMPPRVRVGSMSVPTPSVGLLGAGVLAGGIGGFFGLRSRGQLQDARTASYQVDMANHHGGAQSSARTANVLFGAAGVLATGALVTWLLAGDEAVTNKKEVAP